MSCVITFFLQAVLFQIVFTQIIGPGQMNPVGVAPNNGLGGFGFGNGMGFGNPALGPAMNGLGYPNAMAPVMGAGLQNPSMMGSNMAAPGMMGPNMAPGLAMPGMMAPTLPGAGNLGQGFNAAGIMATGLNNLAGSAFPNIGGLYGGVGSGDLKVAGELPVAGTTVVAGQVPIVGAVQFGGDVRAGGVVTISGSCGCGSTY